FDRQPMNSEAIDFRVASEFFKPIWSGVRFNLRTRYGLSKENSPEGGPLHLLGCTVRSLSCVPERQTSFVRSIKKALTRQFRPPSRQFPWRFRDYRRAAATRGWRV